MKIFVLVLVAVLGCLPAAVAGSEKGPMKAAGAVEWKDAAGDMGPITTSDGEEPPLDLVLLAIKSDGKRITFAATLNDAPGRHATSAAKVYIDADNNPATGTKGFNNGPGGFEYGVELDMCIKYSDGGEACIGGSTGGKPTARYGAVDLKRFKGASEYDTETVVDAMGFPGSKAAVQTPMTGKVVEGSIEYADIKAKPGQVLRILAKESGGSPTDGDGSFPIVLLTLK